MDEEGYRQPSGIGNVSCTYLIIRSMGKDKEDRKRVGKGTQLVTVRQGKERWGEVRKERREEGRRGVYGRDGGEGDVTQRKRPSEGKENEWIKLRGTGITARKVRE